jgi:hypothetical protein
MLGKFYLVDAGYGVKHGFLPPFRGVRYHLNEWGNNSVQNEKELFNHRHSYLRVIVERAFGSLKRRFKILDDATPFYPFSTQVEIMVACCTIGLYKMEVMTLSLLRVRNCLPLIIKHLLMDKQQSMPLCLTSSRNLPMPCGKTIMQIIYDCYIFLLMCLSLVWTRRTCIFSLYAHISFICMHMYVAEIWTCTLANLLKYGYVLWQTIFLNLMYLLS